MCEPAHSGVFAETDLEGTRLPLQGTVGPFSERASATAALTFTNDEAYGLVMAVGGWELDDVKAIAGRLASANDIAEGSAGAGATEQRDHGHEGQARAEHPERQHDRLPVPCRPCDATTAPPPPPGPAPSSWR